jgi:flagellar biosynthesis/type III secretory pathway M-ring protein FliF/YscJ
MLVTVLVVIGGVLLLAGLVALFIWRRRIQSETYYSARHRNERDSDTARVVIGLDPGNNTGGR